MEHTAQLKPNPDVVFTRFDETSAALLNLRSKRYYTLNETGARIWELMESGEGPAAIVARLEAEFEVTETDARDAVDAFFEDLRGEGLVVG